MNTPYGSPDVEPDIAESAEFTSPTEYTVTLKPGLKWANGNDLTSSDVKFSFDRQVAINDENGPASLLYNLDSVEAPDDTTVVFHLKSENDQLFPQILSSPAGPIVDEDVFAADALTSDQDIVDGNAFAGQYTITGYKFNELVSYEAYDGYEGLLGPAKTDKVAVKYFAEASNMKLEIQQGKIDVAWRSLSATDIEDLRGNDDVKVVDGPGGEIRYITFNFDTAVRRQDAGGRPGQGARRASGRRVAHRPRRALGPGLQGHLHPAVLLRPRGPDRRRRAAQGDVRRRRGQARRREGAAALDRRGRRDARDAQPAVLERPLRPVVCGRVRAHQGPAREGRPLHGQPADHRVGHVRQERTSDVYPAYQLGWFPDYSDADNYLTPFFLTENFLVNHYANQEVNDLILQQAATPTPTSAPRSSRRSEQGRGGPVDPPVPPGCAGRGRRDGRGGAEDTLDPSFKFRYAALSKG